MSKKSYQFQFSIGDKVSAIQQGRQQYFKPCELCDGTGSIIVKMQHLKCPECYGTRGRFEYKDTAWYVSYTLLTIGQVRMEHTKGESPKFIAMCKETGVGSGTLHNMDSFYPSLEEAQAECDKRNK